MASSLRDLLERGLVSPALLPEKNDHLLNEKGKQVRKALIPHGGKDLGRGFHDLPLEEKIRLINFPLLDNLHGYTVPLIKHDYGAKTPAMWNTLYEIRGMPVRNLMMVANPENIGQIIDALRKDPKYLGGGAGVGFKEAVIPYLDTLDPIDLQAVNIIVKENGKLIGKNTDAYGFVTSLEEKLQEAGRKLKGSNIVLLGAGGVGKEVARLIASMEAGRITILNRKISKAVKIAHELNQVYGDIAVGGGEEAIRGYALNSFLPPDAIINTTDKGSDGELEKYAAFASAPLPATPETIGNNNTSSRTIARELQNLNPKVVVADIVLHSSGKTTTLRIAENEDLNYILDGRPMVIYQAVPAYKMIERAHPQAHKNTSVPETEVLEIFRKAAA